MAPGKRQPPAAERPRSQRATVDFRSLGAKVAELQSKLDTNGLWLQNALAQRNCADNVETLRVTFTKPGVREFSVMMYLTTAAIAASRLLLRPTL